MDRWMTAEELARDLGVSPGTVMGWAKSGRIPVIRASRRIYRFDLDEVIAALKGHGQDAQGVQRG